MQGLRELESHAAQKALGPIRSFGVAIKGGTCEPGKEQIVFEHEVTVAKARTMFQADVVKAGEIDVRFSNSQVLSI